MSSTSSDPRPPGPDARPSSSSAADPASDAGSVSRRSFLRSAGLSAAAAAAASPGAVARERALPAEAEAIAAPTFGPMPATVTMRVNGEAVAPSVEPATSLLEALRNDLGLTGSKQVCDRASCGGCTVIVDGEPVASCMMLAHDAGGCEVRTIEGMRGTDGSLHPLQEAFVRHDALQCGYCTPGFVMAAAALIERTPKPTLDEIKAGLAGNICRCGTYTNMFNAVLEATGQPPIADAAGGDR